MTGKAIVRNGNFVEIHTTEGPLVLTSSEYTNALRRGRSVEYNRILHRKRQSSEKQDE